jgi:N-acetylglucosamine malate deacetylase 1
MKPTLNSAELTPLLAIGAHPDDIEFGCGGVIASETHAGRKVHCVVCAGGHRSAEILTLIEGIE